MGLKPRAVVVIDIDSGRVVKRYATATEAAEEEFCRYETIRDRCNHLSRGVKPLPLGMGSVKVK